MTIATRTMDDALQIVEQIVPYFTPEFTVTANFSEFNTKIDVPITIQAVNPEIDFEGDTSTQRSVIFTIDFVALSYVFSPVKNQGYITNTDVTTFNSFFTNDGITGPTGAASKVVTASRVHLVKTRCHQSPESLKTFSVSPTHLALQEAQSDER